jgi:hypothetical protein
MKDPSVWLPEPVLEPDSSSSFLDLSDLPCFYESEPTESVFGRQPSTLPSNVWDTRSQAFSDSPASSLGVEMEEREYAVPARERERERPAAVLGLRTRAPLSLSLGDPLFFTDDAVTGWLSFAYPSADLKTTQAIVTVRRHLR